MTPLRNTVRSSSEMPAVEIEPFRPADVDGFLLLAAAEGWICDRWEFDFLLRTFPAGCLVARTGGEPVAFITSVKYDRSGWIGNLIVREELRGRGLGTLLMERVLSVLADAGARTVWLTASTAGEPVYGRLGFAAVDTVKRWCGTGKGGAVPPSKDGFADMLRLDRAGWGDVRETLLSAAAARGKAFHRSGGFIVVQPTGDGLQLGPWGCGDRETAGWLLEAALAQAGRNNRVFLDVPVRNVAAAALLQGRGFAIRGSSTLMCLGEKPRYAAELVYALASMGSMG